MNIDRSGIEKVERMGSGLGLYAILAKIKDKITSSPNGLVISGKPPYGHEAESSIITRSGINPDEFDVSLISGISGRQSHLVIGSRGKGSPSALEQSVQRELKTMGPSTTYRAQCLLPGNVVVNLSDTEETAVMDFLTSFLSMYTSQESDRLKSLKFGTMGRWMTKLPEKIWASRL